MFDEGILQERRRKRYTHRISIAGEPIECIAFVAEKHRDVPLDRTRHVVACDAVAVVRDITRR